jgi:hypothetical protein
LDNKDKRLKAFFVFISDSGKAIEPLLSALAQKSNAYEVALTYLSRGNPAVADYKINLGPAVKNTVMIYRRRRVTQNFVNLQADDKDLASLQAALSEAMNH